MRFGSVCSGIEAASVAWHPLGWEAAWLSEIEPFPCAVLKHHYPDVPNHGDMTLLPEKILSGEVEAPDLFCGGTPCQAFSVAGLRNSLDDARGNLSLTFVGIANAIDHVRSVRRAAPAIVFWENVPGVLNTKDNAFGCFLGALAGEDEAIVPPGEKWTNSGCVFGPQRTVAWRVLDAQYFGVAQRRRRVFVVASARDDFNPAEVLFEFEGVRRDTAPSRQAREEVAGTIAARFGISRNNHEECVATPEYLGNAEGGAREVPFLTCHNTGGTAGISNQTPLVGSYTPSSIGGYREGVGTLRANGGDIGGGSENLVATMLDHQTVGALCADSHPGAYSGQDAYTGRLIPTQTYAIQGSMIGRNDNAGPQGDGINVELCFTQNCVDRHAVAHSQVFENHGTDSRVKPVDVCPTVTSRWGTGGNNVPLSMQTMAVRRLTPTECERLQGFPDGYTNIPWRKAAEAPDGPRYKALGNSWAVPVVAWIGKRIQERITT
jgi:DNA (cytosine-5)-methyltransferase 1